MDSVHIYQLAIFSLEATITAILLLGLFRLRFRLGLSPLYVTLGVFQPIQVLLASSIYVEIVPGITVSPGSVILFTASLFAVLLVYIQEDAREARKAIYGIMLANISMSIFLYAFGLHIDLPGTLNFLGLPREIFQQNARVMMTGTLVLFADVVLIIFVYELLGRWLKNHLFLCIYLTMALILLFDSLGFCTGAFWGQANYGSILSSGIIGKLMMAVFYATAMTLYLKFWEPKTQVTHPFADIFSALTYRQKYEIARQRGDQAETELFRWEQIFLSAGWGIILLDPDEGTILSANHSFARMHGYSRDEVIGMDQAAMSAPESRAALEEHVAIVRDQEQDTFESIHISRDGHTFPVLIDLHTIRDGGGEPLYLVANVQDITERKQAEVALLESEAKYRVLVENQSDMVVKVDLEGRLLFVSPSYCTMFGKEEGELLGKQCMPLVHEDDREPTAKAMEALFSPPHTAYLEQRALTKEGWTWIAWLDTAILDSAGKVKEIIGVGRDISERKQMEEEKEHLQAQIQQAQKMEAIGKLAGGVAHDFNNMLSVILGYAEILKEALADEPNRLEEILEIERAALRSRDTTRQLLAFSRQQAIEPKSIDLSHQLGSLEKPLARLLGEDIALEVQAAAELWPIHFDPSQLDHVLFNLAINARDAMPDGGLITIGADNTIVDRLHDPDHPGITPGNYVLLQVRDTGVGMDAATLSHIFEPFFTTKDVGNGSGLGLATVYGIIKQNEGFIYAESTPGQGTVFELYLPQSETDQQGQEKKETTQTASGSERILLVEDDPMVRELTQKMLENLGYHVMAMAGPRPALTALSATPPPQIDLLLTDVVMPEMNGAELRDQVRALRPEIKTLFMSGYPETVISRHGVIDQGVHFIQKPFSKEVIGQKIHEALHPTG
ncbi:PAS domain S-box protein [Desulfogranum mediterraneum]|uniref:PAS domain S-box protein n=1 Tax=Desulfogranum mediterraneum TaxID=160661 RepID=UPI000422A148|nr:PAS domain S-box protein [Desulfogranum mediterraneum]